MLPWKLWIYLEFIIFSPWIWPAKTALVYRAQSMFYSKALYLKMKLTNKLFFLKHCNYFPMILSYKKLLNQLESTNLFSQASDVQITLDTCNTRRETIEVTSAVSAPFISTCYRKQEAAIVWLAVVKHSPATSTGERLFHCCWRTLSLRHNHSHP